MPAKAWAGPHVLIVIPCHNEAPRIARKLRNTLALTYPAKTIIVVDDYSSDGTEAEARRVSAQGVLVLRNAGSPGKNSAVAEALRRVASDLLCLTDADVLVGPDALERLVAQLADARVGAACGVQRFLAPTAWDAGELAPLPMSPEDRCSHVLRIVETRIDSMVSPHGQFLLVRRTAEPWIEPGIRGDDVEIGLRMRAGGLRVVYVPETSFYDRLPEGTGGYFRQRFRRAQAVQERFLRHWRMLFNPRYGWFGLVCFPAEFFLYVLQPVVALAVALGWLAARGHALLGLIAAAIVAGLPPLRRYAAVNALLLWGLLRLGRGRGLGDRWAREGWLRQQQVEEEPPEEQVRLAERRQL